MSRGGRHELDAIGRACSVYHVENDRSVSISIQETRVIYIDSMVDTTCGSSRLNRSEEITGRFREIRR